MLLSGWTKPAAFVSVSKMVPGKPGLETSRQALPSQIYNGAPNKGPIEVIPSVMFVAVSSAGSLTGALTSSRAGACLLSAHTSMLGDVPTSPEMSNPVQLLAYPKFPRKVNLVRADGASAGLGSSPTCRHWGVAGKTERWSSHTSVRMLPAAPLPP